MRFDSASVNRSNWFGLRTAVKDIASLRLLNAPLRLAAKAVLPDHLRNRVPVAIASVAYRLRDGESVELSSPRRCVMARNVYWGQGRLTDGVDQSVLDLTEALARTAELFLDIGAYTGLFSLIAGRANPRIRAEAFEIVPENYLLLVENVVRNGFSEVITPRLLGLGEKTGTISMPLRMNLASLPSSLSLSSTFPDGISVPVRPLDSVLPGFSGSALLKIDVEGFEPEVLRGAVGFLRRNEPDIICEVLTSMNTAPALESVLKEHGYFFYHFTRDGLTRRERIHPERGLRDWLFSKKSATDLIDLRPGLRLL